MSPKRNAIRHPAMETTNIWQFLNLMVVVHVGSRLTNRLDFTSSATCVLSLRGASHVVDPNAFDVDATVLGAARFGIVLWTPLNIILFNLVCSDFSVALLGNPFTLISALFHRWIFGHNMCVLYGFFMALLDEQIVMYSATHMAARTHAPREGRPRQRGDMNPKKTN
ncbi:Melanopsin-B [Eumeta japonica]|uniref:Melanopsin-B n=1 Tax=Eumeta variegata TaxID=151549 RepID=A0A4C1XMV6_EUMVA|nr:Melanopsin-B [Eumeta japonica]